MMSATPWPESTQTPKPIAGLAYLQLGGRCKDVSGARGAERMDNRDGSAIEVQPSSGTSKLSSWSGSSLSTRSAWAAKASCTLPHVIAAGTAENVEAP